MIRRTMWFSGTVQGVGFRYTASHIARQLRVRGYVKNLPDGRVELVAEAEAGEIDRLAAALREEMAGYVRGVKIEESAPTGEFDGFGVRV